MADNKSAASVMKKRIPTKDIGNTNFYQCSEKMTSGKMPRKGYQGKKD